MPSAAVVAVCPFTVTVAPEIGDPVAEEVTVPVTLPVVAAGVQTKSA